MDSGFQVLDSGLFVSWSWIPDLNRYWDFGLFYSKAQDSEASHAQPRETGFCLSPVLPSLDSTD